MLRVKIIFWINVAGISVTWGGERKMPDSMKENMHTTASDTHTHKYRMENI